MLQLTPPGRVKKLGLLKLLTPIIPRDLKRLHRVEQTSFASILSPLEVKKIGQI